VTGAAVPFDLQRYGLEFTAEFLERAGLAPERAETLLTAPVGTTPSTTVYEENKLELRHYAPDDPRHETPILLVYALVNRPYILDLQPDRSVIRRLTGAGFDVYLLDWGEPSRLDRSLTMADYVGRYLDNCVDAAREHAGAGDLHLLGYCMGGTMAIMYACLHPEPVRTLSLLATPVAFDGTGGILERWAAYYDPDAAVETLGNVPAELLSAEFAMMDPVDQYLGKYAALYDNLDDDAFVANFARMERWIRDGVDVAGAAFAEFVGEIYQDNRLAEGRYDLDGRPVRLGDLDVPLLQVVGENDHIVPAASSRPLHDLAGSEDQRLIEFPRGHIGISVSSMAHETLWPEVSAWLAARDAGVDGGAGAAEPDGAAGGDDPADVGSTPDPTATARATVEAVAAKAGAAVGAATAAEPAVEPAVAPGVETVDGIGPTYGARLRAAGIETTAGLAARDAEDVAAAAEAPVGRAEGWLDRVA
jgi:polyhydroxyalkanoate synthase